MSEKRKIRIGLLGFGVVGQGVWKNIEKNREALEYRLGAQLVISDIVVKDLGRERDVKAPKSLLSTDPSRVVDNPEIDIVCELMGGTKDALDWTRRALQRGKIVVSANKALICEHGENSSAPRGRTGPIIFSRPRSPAASRLSRRFARPWSPIVSV